MFTSNELETLRVHQLAVFRGKIICNARPPISAHEIAQVEARIAGPIPDELLALWRVAFGGKLDYALTVSLGEHRYSASFRELFWPGSDGYHDLWGWMDHELELMQDVAAERGRSEPTRLEVIPFGGFEYCERVYVSLADGERGQVVLWAEGLPPAWKMRLHEDSAAIVAADVNALFDQLELDADPFEADRAHYPSGLELVDAVSALREQHPQLADKLAAVIRSSVFDWKSVVAAGPYTATLRQQRAAEIALTTACRDDDVGGIEALLGNGYPVDSVITGTSPAIAVAMAHGAHRVAHRLIDSGKPLGDAVIVFARGTGAELVEKLVARDLAFEVEAVLSAAAAGDLETALRIAAAARRAGDWSNLQGQVRQRADQEDLHARDVDQKHLISETSAAEFREHARHLRALANRL